MEAQIAGLTFDFSQDGTNGFRRLSDHDPHRIGEFEPVSAAMLDDGFNTVAHVPRLSRIEISKRLNLAPSNRRFFLELIFSDLSSRR
jgi:hypothetical protein